MWKLYSLYYAENFQQAQLVIYPNHPYTRDPLEITPDHMGLHLSEWIGLLDRESKILFDIKLLNL